MKTCKIYFIFQNFVIFCLPFICLDPFQNFFDKLSIYDGGKFKESKQIVLVVQKKRETFFSKLYAYEKIGNKWKKVLGPKNAVVGKSGFAELNNKLEGDGKTPSGIYEIGPLFYHTEEVKTKLDKVEIQDNDYWIDDVDSEYYNCWVRGELPKDVKSYEKMKIPVYKYCVVIRYNMNPVVKGKGSAIFLHLWKSKKSPTSGCVAVSEKVMKRLLLWLDKEKKPIIILGTKETILQMFKN